MRFAKNVNNMACSSGDTMSVYETASTNVLPTRHWDGIASDFQRFFCHVLGTTATPVLELVPRTA